MAKRKSETKLLIPDADKPALWVSDIWLLGVCEMKWAYRRLENKWYPGNFAAHVGSATHKSVEENLSYKISTKQEKMLTETDCADAARDEIFRILAREGVTLDDEEKTVGINKLRGKAIDEAVRLSVKHRQRRAPDLLPVAVEKRIRIILKDQPWDLSGRLDIEEERAVIDTKTSKSRWAAGDIEKDYQLLAYALGLKLKGKEINRIGFDILVKRKDPAIQILTLEPTDEDYQRLLNRVALLISRIQTGVFKPAEPDHWMCSKKWCEFYDICPYGQRGRGASVTVPEIKEL